MYILFYQNILRVSLNKTFNIPSWIPKFASPQTPFKGHWQPKFLLLHLKEHEKIRRLAV